MSRARPDAAALARFLVRLASQAVPAPARREWAAEWTAELCHVCRSRAGAPVSFALGAFQDVFWIRFDGAGSRARSLFPHGSALRCCANLLLLAAIGLLLCVGLPGPRRAIAAALSRTPPDLVSISSDGYDGTQFPSISMAEYRGWRTAAPSLFTQVAFYRPVLRRIRLDHHRPATLAVAFASENLLHVLDLPVVPSNAQAARQLFLTQAFWRQQLHADPNLIGTTAIFDSKPVVIAGILPDRASGLPGNIQALLTEDSRQLDALPPRASGFVFARLRPSAFATTTGAWHFIFEQRNNSVSQFECIPVSYISGQPISIFLFALLAACMALPATTALRLGEYADRREHLGRAGHLRRWSFLFVKVVLVVLIVAFWSFALAYADAPVGSTASLCLQLGTAFPALLFAFRWTFHDQRRRCPVCLRLLSNPARVGQPSWNFLAWCGTEWVCQSGHGLLHIPELPTCWFSAQRWLQLDPSWASLFPAGPAGS